MTDPRNSDAQAAFGASAPPHRPSRLGYVAGGLLCAGAVVGAVLWLVLGLVGTSHAVRDLHRVPIPGSAVMALGSGRKAIYYEGPGGSDATVPQLRIVIRPAGGGPLVPIGSHSGSVSYDMGGHAGRSVAGIGIPETGDYRVTVTVPGGRGPAAHLAIGRGIGGRIVRAIVGAIAIFIVGGLAGGGVIALTATRRSRGIAQMP